MEFDELNQLREAIKSSPDNLPLRKYLANLLIKKERWEEAELEYKAALKLAPEDLELQIGLANTFHAQEKTGLGLVLIEEITKQSAPPPAAWLVYAKLLLQSGQAHEAKDAYENALALAPNLKDNLLEANINLKAQQNSQSEAEKIKLR